MSLREGTSNRMADNIFNPIEMDAIGEVMNISLGSSATAISNMLDHRVEITTPRVSVCDVQDFTLGELQPAVGVEIRYISGLEGSNIMLLKRSDVKVIVDILMGADTPEEEFELNELTVSAVCEVMNQMMGAASTALSDFLGYPVNISTPESFEVSDFESFKKNHFPVKQGPCVVVHFALNIEGVLKSEFINVMSADLTRGLLQGLGVGVKEETAEQQSALDSQPAADSASGGGVLSQEEIERLMNISAQSDSAPASNTASGGDKLIQEEVEQLMNNSVQSNSTPASDTASSGGKLSQEEIERLVSANKQSTPAQQPQQSGPAQIPHPEAYPMPPYGQQYAQGYYPPPGYYPVPPAPQPTPKVIHSKAAELPRLSNGQEINEQQAENLDLLMSVPLEVSVEIGRARRKVQDVLAFTKGSLVMLNKLAGDQVDLFVNGQCIAKGDVVVVDDNFGIRITEVLKAPDPNELING